MHWPFQIHAIFMNYLLLTISLQLKQLFHATTAFDIWDNTYEHHLLMHIVTCIYIHFIHLWINIVLIIIQKWICWCECSDRSFLPPTRLITYRPSPISHFYPYPYSTGCCLSLGINWHFARDSQLLTERCASGVKWYIHFLSPKRGESRLPWRQLGATIPLPRLEVL